MTFSLVLRCAETGWFGEAGRVHSAGIMIVDEVAWPVANRRCDWPEDCPIAAVATAWDVNKPQMDGYVQRAGRSDNGALLRCAR